MNYLISIFFFRVNIDEGSENDKKFESLSDSQKEFLVILHRIFSSFIRMKNQMEESTNEEKEKERREKRKKEEEIKKQKTLCCYLRVRLSYLILQFMLKIFPV